MAEATTKSEIQKQLDEWRENAKHMYERLDTISLDWPSLTAQWSLDDEAGQRALVATYTLGAEAELIREVEVNTDKLAPEAHKIREWPVPMATNVTSDDVTHEAQKLVQNPHNPDIFAAFPADSGDVFVYRKSSAQFETKLVGHSTSGFSLAWSPKDDLKLVSGSDDGQIILWQGTLEKNKLTFTKIAEKSAQTIVNEITWTHPNRIVVALESGKVWILNDQLVEERLLNCQSEGINTASLSPFAPDLLVTGSADNRWRLFDIRRSPELDSSDPKSGLLYENFAHEGAINAARWSPHVDGVLATAGMDGVVYLWDIRKIGQDQPHEDVEDGAAELLFKHNGHLKGDQVQDIDWHPKIPYFLLSCDGRNALMSWKPNMEALETPEAPEMPSYLI